MNVLQGNGCTVTVDERSISITSKLETDHQWELCSVDALSEWKQQGDFCSFQIFSENHGALIRFAKEDRAPFQALYRQLGQTAVNGITRLVQTHRMAYVGGNSSIPKKSNVTMEIYDRFIEWIVVAAQKEIQRLCIPYQKIHCVKAMRMETIREEYENSYVFLFGPMAALYKKKPVKKQKLLVFELDLEPTVLAFFESDDSEKIAEFFRALTQSV
ncbi:MAG: hypothetical protein J6D18_03495 [Erysipelotrichaceae bacterium]|nr:hypothetical protein [Erysipelotrichaceae bacterium]